MLLTTGDCCAAIVKAGGLNPLVNLLSMKFGIGVAIEAAAALANLGSNGICCVIFLETFLSR